MLNYIMELAESRRYDRIVWDTAPAGHTLRLLQLPQLFLNHLEAAVKFYVNLYGTFEKISSTVRLKKSKRTLLQIIEGWKELSQKVLDFIRNKETTAFLLVTIAEALGVHQTERILKDFDAFHLDVRYLVINNLVKNADCAFHRQRQAMQRKYVKFLREAYGQRMTLVELPLLPYEVRGTRRISRVSNLLFRKMENGEGL